MLDFVKKKWFIFRWRDVTRRWPLEMLLNSTDLELSEQQMSRLTDRIHSWRQLVAPYLKRFGQIGERRQVYCFGVAHGSTLHGLVSGFQDHDLPLPDFHLFDSFEGLPEEKLGVQAPLIWEKGAFAAPKEKLLAMVKSLNLGPDKYKIHEGWFSDTLKAELVADGTFLPAAYVDIDGDLYSSTMDCLDFLLEHKLIQAGTIIGYDDWGDTDIWTAGESRAHKEVLDKYNVTCAQLLSWGQQPLIKKLFVVISVGDESLITNQPR
ncbi:TylF/MycF/NovP-related O-methyltransferase [Roseovarius arcticus]|uniref:TylF/MycF/NovP-related O-methyltransferase n=1 Tax=Roseovarius arcticus TaxID=2547404 RepID=UPI001110DDF5|nr:TylF/MycF/NovP-related O-methyltransferase [Roseovarius arcticus]